MVQWALPFPAWSRQVRTIKIDGLCPVSDETGAAEPVPDLGRKGKSIDNLLDYESWPWGSTRTVLERQRAREFGLVAGEAAPHGVSLRLRKRQVIHINNVCQGVQFKGWLINCRRRGLARMVRGIPSDFFVVRADNDAGRLSRVVIG